MSESAESLTRRWFEEVWNQDNEAAIDALMLPECKAFGFPDPTGVTDREGFKEAFRQFRSAFSEVHVTLDDTVSEGNKTASRWTAVMKHSGDGLGFAPTGETVTIHGMSIAEYRDGKLVQGWNALDLTSHVARLA
ncbi:MAG TPA: ester cyclase, partial [Acidobacteriaceae bacterium]